MEIATLALSCVSIIIAIISLSQSIKSQRLQDKVNQINYKLKAIELSEIEKSQNKKPFIEARIIHIGDNKYKIKIWNSGKAIAKNISVEWDSSEIVFWDKDKLPYEFLPPQKSFDLVISIYFGSPKKMNVTASWEDDIGNKYSEKYLCDF